MSSLEEAHSPDSTVSKFSAIGFTGPFDLLTPEEARQALEDCSRAPDIMLPWMKGRHAMVEEMANLATHPTIIDKVSAILGNDVILWGSQIIEQYPGGKHRWHMDVERAHWEGVTVWLAIQNVLSEASFSIITGSHLIPASPQELEFSKGIDLKDDSSILQAALEFNPEATIQSAKVRDGQFIIFAGKAWHGTQNPSSQTRYSMIFQYTRPDSVVKIARNNKFPDTAWYRRRPLCILVKGKDDHHVNEYLRHRHPSNYSKWVRALCLYMPRSILDKLQRALQRP